MAHRTTLALLLSATLLGGALAAAPVAAAPRPPARGRPASGTPTSRSTATAATTSRTTGWTCATGPATDRLQGVATIHARARRTSPGSTSTSTDSGSSRCCGRPAAPGRARRGELRVTPRGRAAPRRTVPRRRPVRRRPRTVPTAPASSTPTTAPWSPASRTWPRPGSRSTTTRATRRPTRSGSSARRPARRRQRRLLARDGPRRLDDLDVGRAGADGVLPRDGRPSASSTCAPTGTGHRAMGRGRPRPLRALAAPRTGRAVRVSRAGRPLLQAADPDHRRPGRRRPAVVLGQPRHRADWDFFFVEAHTAGGDDWTTLPDTNGHTTRTPASPARSGSSSPVPRHYQTVDADGSCTPTGTTGSGTRRRAPATATSSGRWTSRLRRPDVESRCLRERRRLSSCTASSSTTSSCSTGQGTTSFEADGDPLDGWTVPGAPAGSPATTTTGPWARVTDSPPPLARSRAASLAPEPEIIDSCPVSFGPYPFRPPAASSTTSTSSASPWRPRPGRSTHRLLRPTAARRQRRRPRARPPVVRRQPGGRRWQTSGSTRASPPTPSGCGASTRARRPRRRSSTSLRLDPGRDPFWSSTIGDPGPEHLFDVPVY